MTPSTTLLKETADCFKAVRSSLIVAAGQLYKISSEKLYEGQYSSFGHYCEEACQISQSFAAKLIRVHEHYVLKGGLSRSHIRGIDSEKLYLAIALPGTPETQAVRAQTWSRSEIKAELASKGGEECAHEQTITICARCNKRI